MLTIEKSIPLPPVRGASARFPFAEMQIGDSFAIAKSDKAAKSLSARARGWAVSNGARDRKFSMRTNGETVRIWRTA